MYANSMLKLIRSVSKCFPYESGDSINTFVAENVKRDRKTETSSSDSIQCGIWCAKCFYYIEKKKKKGENSCLVITIIIVVQYTKLNFVLFHVLNGSC